MKKHKVVTFIASGADLARIDREREFIAERNPNIGTVTRTLAIKTLLERGDVERFEE